MAASFTHIIQCDSILFWGLGLGHPSCGNGHRKPVVDFQGEARQGDVRFTIGERLGCFGAKVTHRTHLTFGNQGNITN